MWLRESEEAGSASVEPAFLSQFGFNIYVWQCGYKYGQFLSPAYHGFVDFGVKSHLDFRRVK